MATQRASAATRRPTQKRTPKKRKSFKKSKFGYRLINLGVGLDLPLLIIVLSLLGIGLIMLFSASFPSALYQEGDSYHDIKRQGIFAVGGVIAMLLISIIDYHQFRRYNLILFGITIFLLILVFIPPFSVRQGEAIRWINLGFTTLQPSEVAKFTLIVMLAHLVAKLGDRMKSLRNGIVPCLVPIIIIVGLIAFEKHISAIVIILCISAVILYVGGVEVKWFVGAGVVAVLLLVFLIFFSGAFDYAQVRILGWLDPFNPPEGVNTYQTKQSLYAIGAGQILGVGLGQSKQKYLYLPEAKNDFIYPIACEELGFLGAVIIMLLFVALIWRGVVISINAKDKFGTLLGMGITFTIGIQAIFNICVVTNAFPNTGVSLPFFSYGGTSLLMLLGEMGVLLSISRNSYVEKT